MAAPVTPITQEWIDQVSASLIDLGTRPPPRPKSFTRQRAIEAMAPLIRDLQAKDFDLEDILPALNVNGQNFTKGSVKTYLARVSHAPAAAVPKRSQKAQPTTSASTGQKAKPAIPDSATQKGASEKAPASDGSRLRAPVAEGTDTI
jgi:hypothetical protein